MSQNTRPMKEIYEEGYRQLHEAGMEEAKLDAWWLLSYVTGIEKTKYYTEPTLPISEEACLQYLDAIDKRKKRIPLQHITKEQEFMGLTFRVNEHVLIPRQDTETLVEEGSKRLRDKMHILDLCTGSGCILISLAEEAKKKQLQQLLFTGADISKEALAVATENDKRYQIKANWVESDLFTQLDKEFDMIISNPPYIKTGVIQELEEEVRGHEPFIALDGKEDGLYFYRSIVAEVHQYLVNDGWLLFEIGYDQGKEVCSLLRQAGYKEVQCQKDLAGLDRVVIGRYNKAEGKEIES